MSTAGMGRQSRLCVILVKVGTPVARAVFEKRVKDLTPPNHDPSPWTVDDFLSENKPKIRSMKLKSQMWSKMFPVQSHVIRLEQWDLALLCRILTECCDLRPDIRLDIYQLRKLRNKLFHMSEPSIDDHKYQHYLAKLKVSFDRCLKETNDDVFTTEMDKMFEDLEHGQFSQVDAEEVMEMLQFMQEETNERFYELGQNQQSTNERLDDLLQKVEVLTTSLESVNKLKVPESGAKIEVRNCCLEKDNEISKLMIQCFEECIDDDDGEVSESSTTSHAKCKEAVHKMYTKLLSKGYKVIDAHKECVFLHIQCSSMASLMSYFHDYVSGQLALELKIAEDTIRTIDGCEDIALEIVINTEEILETINGIVTTVSELMKTEGILSQTAEEEIQSKRKIVETGCAEQGIQDDTTNFQTSVTSNRVRHSERITTVSELIKTEGVHTQITEGEIQSKGKYVETDYAEPGMQYDTADFKTPVTSKIFRHRDRNKRHLYENEKLCVTKERVYWLKALKGLSITKDVVLPLVSSIFRQFYNNCTVNERGHIQHLLTIASNRDTYKQVTGVQTGPNVWDVNCSDCKPLLMKLLRAHWKPSQIEWGNIGAGGVDDYWKIAKLFMPCGNKDSRGDLKTQTFRQFSNS
ncbi:uncharacterized protein LOC123546648 [Mercenaria mercenaria]|uniref:uncharacterized protein LOC123546648 n=1 Tax=Mercenaria mercenaria TaxID=6596 RepID=UPI00234E6964|nr:uncharacterized protein LOC123546648 [Mercenaria mercenaria]